jgi:UDP-N-acetylmuramoylalanine--D-glutamate ligase
VITLHTFSGKNIAVMGLGKSGLSTARALSKGGASVQVWDDNVDKQADAAREGFTVIEPTAETLRDIDALVLSPGIPLTFPAPHPVAAAARAAGVPIIGDIELLAREQSGARFIGITGTNGKSTTTALIGHIFDIANRKAQTGGNLGTPALDLDPVGGDTGDGDTGGGDGAYILEMSSFQLELIDTLRFDIAVLINISPDHIDRHGDFDGYIAAKKHIFDCMDKDGTVIIGIDDPNAMAIYDELRARGGPNVIPISAATAPDGGVFAKDGVLFDALSGAPTSILSLRDIKTLPGRHNHQNAAAAYAAARAAGVSIEHIIEGLRTYPGLPHRQQIIAEIGGVRYINDSKATNPDATANALASYESIYWIAGGLGKDGGLDQLSPYFPRIEHAFLIGAAADEIHAALDGKAPHDMSGDLTTALRAAHAMAQQAPSADKVVLLSPACASYDQFPNFEARGDAFAAIVQDMEDDSCGEART